MTSSSTRAGRPAVAPDAPDRPSVAQRRLPLWLKLIAGLSPRSLVYGSVTFVQVWQARARIMRVPQTRSSCWAPRSTTAGRRLLCGAGSSHALVLYRRRIAAAHRGHRWAARG